MKSLLSTVVASFVAAMLTNQEQGGTSLIQGVQSLRIKSAFQQHAASQLQDLPEDNQFAQTQAQMGQKAAIQMTNKLEASTQVHQKAQAEVDAKSQAQWGFLKNIVNIDRFFSSGVEDKKSDFIAKPSKQSKQIDAVAQKSEPAPPKK